MANQKTDIYFEACARLLDLMRAKGVAKFEGYLPGDSTSSAPVKIEMGPLPVGDQPPSTTKADELAGGKCRCGHFEYEHQAGLCVRGCEIDQCAPTTEDIKAGA